MYPAHIGAFRQANVEVAALTQTGDLIVLQGVADVTLARIATDRVDADAVVAAL